MKDRKIKVSIEGGAGYVAGELIRILLNHPMVEISSVHSESHQGVLLSKVHRDLLGETTLCFRTLDLQETDILFYCKGHGHSPSFLNNTKLPAKLKFIDMGRDFRNEKKGFVYGLTELNGKRVASSYRITNPGCFATSILLGLLPMAHAGLLNDEVHIQAITGSSGSGQTYCETSHYSWRANNISVYKPFIHEHLDEIKQTIHGLQPGFDKDINFIPLRGNYTRGIHSCMYTNTPYPIDLIRKMYEEYYNTEPFIVLSDELPSLKQVVNTNKCIIYLEKHKDKLLIISIIDNLIKGASGQAVQNMNLMFGLEPTLGLILKSTAF